MPNSTPPLPESDDAVIDRHLGDELLQAMLLPPRMPAFACETLPAPALDGDA